MKNVLFIISHDVSRRFGCYTDPEAVTPNIDRLARQSMLFDRHHCHYSLCGPSRTNIFTSLRPDTSQRYSMEEPDYYGTLRGRMPAVRTLPEHLKNHGYFSKSLHKVFHEYEQDPPSWSEPSWYPGLPERPDWMPDDFECIERATRYATEQNQRLMRERFTRLVACEPDAARQFKRWRAGPVECADVDDDAYFAGRVAAEARRQVERLRGRQPFFLGVGFSVTHMPWLSPRKYWDLHPEERIRAALDARGGVWHSPQDRLGTDSEYSDPAFLPPRGIDEPFARSGNEAYQYFQQDYENPGASAAWVPTKEEAIQMVRGYYASVSYLDAQVGRILEGLDASGMAENTIVVFTTDHGFSLGEHAHWGKNTPHEPDMCVPLLIRAPGVEPGRTRALTEHVDIFPTLCELCGVPVPSFVEGVSMVRLLRDPNARWKQAVFGQAQRGGLTAYSVRTDRHRCTRWETRDGSVEEIELYDYQADPGESVSVARDPRYGTVVQEMNALLDSGWQAQKQELEAQI